MTILASGIVLFRHAPGGTRLLVLRNRDKGHWGFAKGRRAAQDGHEVDTARREVAEETGYTGLTLDGAFRVEIGYRVAGADGSERDKRVVYFLAEAPGDEPALSPEHDAWRWIGPGELAVHIAHDALRGVALAALAAATRARS